MTAPEEIHNVSQSQFSVARHYGGCTYMGQAYIYDTGQDRLIRRDVYLARPPLLHGRHGHLCIQPRQRHAGVLPP